MATAKTKTRKSEKTLKAVKEKCTLSVDENLQKLAKSRLPMMFVKAHNGEWNHQDWLDFLADIKARGYEPVDEDRVGLILEDKKAKFLADK